MNKIRKKKQVIKKDKKNEFSKTDKRIVELTTLSLLNFKAFGDNQKPGSPHEEVDLQDFAPLTFIFGKNSSGKSSIIQSLNLLAQSFFRGNGIETLRGNGELTNLGLFDAYINKHDIKKMLKYSLTIKNKFVETGKTKEFGYQLAYERGENKFAELQELFYYYDFIHNKPEPDNGLRFVYDKYKNSNQKFCRIGRPDLIDKIKTGQKLLKEIEKEYSEDKVIDIEVLKNFLEGINIATTRTGLPIALGRPMYLESKDKKQEAKIQKINNLVREIVEKKEQEFFTAIYTGMRNYLEESLSPFEILLSRYQYIGPAREAPKRTQVKKGNSFNVGVSGEQAADILVEKKEIIDSMNEILKKLEVPYKINLRIYNDDIIETTYAIVLTDIRTNTEVSTYDVGFGIFQFIPFIVQGLYPTKNIIACEQPEIHLHPALIADLADFFIETTNLEIKDRLFDLNEDLIRNDRFIFGNQWIIETHSE
ncbi:MAG: AAA family ATPase, partial [Alphaproteobacteria bacterium]